MSPGDEERSGRGWPALLCALAGAAVFQFFGNASFGYIKSASLFWWWGYQWVDKASETEHGWLILGVAAWLLWRNLRQTKIGDRRAEIGAVWPALAAMVVALGLHLAGFAAQQARVSIIGLLLFTWGVLRLGGGRRWGEAAAFPLGLLVLAIPINALDTGFYLRVWVIKASSALAHAVGIGVLRNGTQLLAPDGSYNYDVAEACSGVRSLVALLALAALVGYLNFRTWWRRGVLLLLCFPLIYIGNVARLASIIFAAHLGGQIWGERLHDVMGYGVFVIVLAGEMLAAHWISKWWPEAARERAAEIGARRSQIEKSFNPQSPIPELRSSISDLRAPRADFRASRAWVAAAVIVVLAVGELLFLARLAGLPPRGQVGVKLAADGQNPVELPAFLGTEWIGRRTLVTAAEQAILPPDTGFSRKNYVAVANPSQWVFLSIVLSGRDRSSIHRPELCVMGQGWTTTAETEHRFSAPGASGGFPAKVLHVQRERQTPRGRIVVPQLIVYWFVGGDTVESSYWRRLARDAWNRVVHARADRWAYVLMQTDASEGETAALARMQTVLDQTLPVFSNR